jgi:hypothetical protein
MIINKHLFAALLFMGMLLAKNCLAQDYQKYFVYDESLHNAKPTGKMGSQKGTSLKINAKSTDQPYEGKHCLEIRVDGQEVWTGLFFQYSGKWKSAVPEGTTLADLSPYKYLIFYARASKDWNIGLVGFGEASEANVKHEKVSVNTNWQRYVFELPENADLTNINAVFQVMMPGKEEGSIFFDNIYYSSGFDKQGGDNLYLNRKDADDNSLYIYSDKWVNGKVTGVWGQKNGRSLKIHHGHSTEPYMGTKCLMIENSGDEKFAGLTISFTGKWDDKVTAKDSLLNLSGYNILEFYARTDGDNKFIPVINIGGGSGPYIQSEPAEMEWVEITKDWKRYRVKIKGYNMTRVNTILGFGVPVGNTFFDEIRFIKENGKQNKVRFE